MDKQKKRLVGLLALVGLNNVVANFVIRSQEKKLKQCFHFQQKLQETLHVFIPYVPDSVVKEHLEHLQFEEIAYHY